MTHPLALPREVSPDGREIWDWAGRLSEAVHRAEKIRELRADINAPKRCGGCQMWMTRQCSREVPDNTSGRSRGPSMNGIVCAEYAEKPYVTERRAALEATLIDLVEAM